MFEFAASIVEFDHGKLLKIIHISQFPLLNDSQKRRKDVFLLVSHDERGEKVEQKSWSLIGSDLMIKWKMQIKGV